MLRIMRSTFRYPRKKSATFTVRSPRDADASVSVAPHAQRRGLRSEMGEAVARLPPTHAAFRICVEANQRSMSRTAPTAPPARRLGASAAHTSISAESDAQPPMVSPASDTYGRVSASCFGVDHQ